MKRKTLFVLLIIAIIGMLFVFADSIYDVYSQIELFNHMIEWGGEWERAFEERALYLIEAVISLSICFFVCILLIVISIGIIKRENLILTEEDKILKKERKEKTKKQKQEKKILRLTAKIKKNEKCE